MNELALDLNLHTERTAAPSSDALFTLTVFGSPQPAGSKKAVPMGKKPQEGQPDKRRWGVVDDAKRSRPWKDLISQEAGELMLDRRMLEGALEVRFVFFVARPKGHYGSRGNLLPSAPRFPAKKPDALKLARAVEDALTGCVYRDDAQIVTELLEKRFGTPERVEITIWEAR